MFSPFPALTVLIVLFLSWLSVRVATVALTLTGLSKDLAHFQALSAFTGSGFTTKESEDIVNDPTRRRIVMFLMLSGNAGIVLAISTIMMSLMYERQPDTWYDETWFRVTLLVGGAILMFLLSNSRLVEEGLWRVNTWTLRRWSHIEVRDYTKLLRTTHDYVVSELRVHDDDWLAGKTLAQSQLASEGVLVLGIEHRKGKYIGAPRGISQIEAGDTLIVYGPHDTVLNLTSRPADIVGNLQHVMSVTKQLDILEAEQYESQSASHKSPGQMGSPED